MVGPKEVSGSIQQMPRTFNAILDSERQRPIMSFRSFVRHIAHSSGMGASNSKNGIGEHAGPHNDPSIAVVLDQT